MSDVEANNSAASARSMLDFGRSGRPPPFVPCLPLDPIADPADVVPDGPGGGWRVVGFATVAGRPHRRSSDARQLAVRIALRPLAYLPLLTRLGVAGVKDVRVSFGKCPEAMARAAAAVPAA